MRHRTCSSSLDQASTCHVPAALLRSGVGNNVYSYGPGCKITQTEKPCSERLNMTEINTGFPGGSVVKNLPAMKETSV